MSRNDTSNKKALAIALRVVRCFNAAAFAALAFFYFASYTLPPLQSHALALVPITQHTH